MSGPPELPGIDRGVRLDERLVFRDPHVVALGGRYDAGRHRMVEPERAPDCQHPVADLKLLGISPLRLHLEIGLYFEHRKVDLGVGTHQLRRHVVAGPKSHHDPIGILDHVVIRDDITPVLVDDHARAQFGTLQTRRQSIRPTRNSVAPASQAKRLYVDDGRRHRVRRHPEKGGSPIDDSFLIELGQSLRVGPGTPCFPGVTDPVGDVRNAVDHERRHAENEQHHEESPANRRGRGPRRRVVEAEILGVERRH